MLVKRNFQQVGQCMKIKKSKFERKKARMKDENSLWQLKEAVLGRRLQ